MRAVTVVGLIAIVTALAIALARSPLVATGNNGVGTSIALESTKGPFQHCQGGEVVPQGTTAIRLWMQTNVKPRVRVAVLARGHPIANGSEVGGWLGKVTTVQISPTVMHTLPRARVCFSFGRAVQAVNLLGGHSRRAEPGEPPYKMRIEYMRPSSQSWWSRAGSIARRLGIGRAPENGWAVALPLIMMVLATILVVVTILRRLGGDATPPPIAGAQTLPQAELESPDALQVGKTRGASRGGQRHRSFTSKLRRGLSGVPKTAWVCACIAFLSAASWSILTPPFQAPDEPSHFAFAQILAETGALPKENASLSSPEESTIVEDLDMRSVRFNPAIETISTSAQQQRLRRDEARNLSRVGIGAGVATSEPPLYYALQTIPYTLGSSGTLLDRLELMRLLSALMGGVAALFAFLFLREALPAVPWAWTVGGLCMALAPLVGYMSGVVNPDAMLCAVSAALFYCLARGFRRGLTPGLAIAIGVAAACGLMTKLNFIGLLPGLVLALVLIARRTAQSSGNSPAYRSLALALAVAVLPSCIYLATIELTNDSAALGAFSEGISGTNSHPGSPLQELSYIWQFYLPRLPGMTDYFPGISTTYQVWFDKSVGMYGWLDTTFPDWVYTAALIPAAAIAALCVRELIRMRAVLRSRAGELLAYAAMSFGLLVLFGADSYTESATFTGAFSEPRYLLPLAVLFASVLALAARGAGRRWGPVAGALIVLLILAHDIFSQLLVVGRYYL